MLPTEGLVRACTYLGIEKHREAYELGVRNLLQALSSHGKSGEFEEGIGYASFTLTALLQAGRAMAVAGDRREVEWTAKQLTVRDEVVLQDEKSDIILFRWRLGTVATVEIKRDGKEVDVFWTDADLRIEGNRALVTRQYKSPDATVTTKEDHLHTCLEVRTQDAVTHVGLVTEVRPRM